ncbi:XRE family transcriptional regulator [Streptomyces sp. NPDC086783]|uniref:XRE family transcriptional regulator n=1 Tax=Streptomyces sp. NPDC086783 TaxID=3365758 RepID=UPI00382DC176
MPRWKALPDELDPQVKEFAGQLRRLVDRGGLSVAAVADRTGYSKTSWERYLNGRLLAPKGAIVALAEVTGTSPLHLVTMWELAERAWSRSEMRHDMTMEAIRISQARAALGEFGPPPGNGTGGRLARRGGSATATPGIAGPAGVMPTVPPQPSSRDVEDASRGSGGDGSRGSGGSGRGGGWGLTGPPPRTSAPADSGPPGPSATGPGGEPPADARPPDGGSPDGARRRRRVTMFLAGTVGTLAVIAVAVLLRDGGGDGGNEGAPRTPAVSASTRADLPAGVKCSGKDCTGKDPESMGCGGQLARTTSSVTVGATLVEVRYSKTCGAAWARITQAAQGDRVEVSSAAAAAQRGSVDGDTDAYTPMVAVRDAGDAKACATLKSGQKGCTR